MSLQRKYLYLAASVLSLLAVFSAKMFLVSEPNQKEYLQAIEKNLIREAAIADEAVFRLKKRLKDGLRFSDLLEDSKYPIYIYQNGQLVFWSNHEIPFAYRELRGYYVERCKKTENGIFLVKKSFQKINNVEYEIISTIPLHRNYGIENEHLHSSLNPEIFPDDKALILLNETEEHAIKNHLGVFQFSVFITEGEQVERELSGLYGLLLLLSMGFFVLHLYEWIGEFLRAGKVGQGFLFLLSVLTLARVVMLVTDVPFRFIGGEIFDPRLFAASVFSPTMGDLLINLFFLLLVYSYFFVNYIRLVSFRRLVKWSRGKRVGVSILLVLTTFLMAYFIHYILESIFFDSKISLDITSDITFQGERLTAISVFIIVSTFYFYTTHIVSKLIGRLLESKWQVVSGVLGGALMFMLGQFLVGFDNYILTTANVSYLFLLQILDLPSTLQRRGYPSFVYLFVCAGVCASLGAYAIYDFDKVRDVDSKNKFATKILVENDILGEFFLNEMVDKIKKDAPFLASQPDDVSKKIRKIYLNRYFDKYDISVWVYGEDGKAYNAPYRLDSLLIRYKERPHRTDYENIYFINELVTGTKRYLCHIPVERSLYDIDDVLIELTLKQIIPNSIYPRFFVDRKYETGDNDDDNYSYAVYVKEKLIYSYGEYIYDAGFLDKFFVPDLGEVMELTTEKFHHLRIADAEKNIIISSKRYPADNVFSNFSFLFLMLVFVVMIFITVNNVMFRQRENKMTFITKIQLYINFAFFLPLIIVSVVTASILTNSNKEETNAYYIEKALTVSAELRQELAALLAGDIKKNNLLETVIEVAKLTQSDINIFSKDGELLVASQSYIFDNDLLSERVNPRAYASLIEQQQSKTLFTEFIGSLKFNAAYVSVKSHETGEVLGIVGIPYFGAKFKADRQVIDVLATIMKVFTIIFISLLVLSYFTSRDLTYPLRLITQKIRKFSLREANEPLDYQSDDEIGLLVGEYNKMLINLEESKRALAQSQKETAWREMAQQVAHEIKNPLTPMQLTLQQLSRVMDSDDERVQRSLKMLLGQIEKLSDIATSFSSFAQMPVPVEEKIELGGIVRQVCSLLQANCTMELDMPKGAFPVIGDAKLMDRVFQNLIINGVQSVPKSRRPLIKVRMQRTFGNRVLIEVSDNGEGIPEEVQNKIFVPNFTTKAEGSGIGLAIAKRGIEHLGGNIWFETDIGKGTSFFVDMPLLG